MHAIERPFLKNTRNSRIVYSHIHKHHTHWGGWDRVRIHEAMAVREPFWCTLLQLYYDRITDHWHVKTISQEICFENPRIEIRPFSLTIYERMCYCPVEDDFKAQSFFLWHAYRKLSWFRTLFRGLVAGDGVAEDTGQHADTMFIRPERDGWTADDDVDELVAFRGAAKQR